MPRDLLADIEPIQQQPKDLLADIDPIGNGAQQNGRPGFGYQMLGDAVNIINGAGDAVTGGTAQFANMLMPKSMQAPIPHNGEGMAYGIGHMGGDIASLLVGAGIASPLVKSAEALPGIGGLAKGLMSQGKLPEMARYGLGNAGYSYVNNPDDRAGNALTGGLFGAGGAAAGGLLSKLMPSKLFRGNLTPEQLLENQSVAKGTETNIGRVIGSPDLSQFYENRMSGIPFSGTTDQMQRVSSEINNRGSKLVSSLLGENSSENVTGAINTALKKASSDAMKLKNKNWAEVNNESDSLGVSVGSDNLSNEAKNILEEIKGSKKLSRKVPESIIADLENHATDLTPETLKSANIYKGTLGDTANEHFMSGNSYHYGIYKRLKEAYKKDVDSAIENSGSQSLKENYDKAMKFHAEHIGPFEEPEVAKYIREGGDPDTIVSTFVKTGNNDRAILANKLMKHMPEDKKGLLAYGYLKPEFNKQGILENPKEVATKYNKLGENQINTIFPDKNIRSGMDSYNKLVGMNTEAMDLMRNPKTGFRDATIWPYLAAALTGSGFGGTFGALAGMGGTSAVANGLSKLLTSETMRNKLIQSMINNNTSNLPKYLGTGMPALRNSMKSDKLNLYLNENTP